MRRSCLLCLQCVRAFVGVLDSRGQRRNGREEGAKVVWRVCFDEKQTVTDCFDCPLLTFTLLLLLLHNHTSLSHSPLSFGHSSPSYSHYIYTLTIAEAVSDLDSTSLRIEALLE